CSMWYGVPSTTMRPIPSRSLLLPRGPLAKAERPIVAGRPLDHGADPRGRRTAAAGLDHVGHHGILPYQQRLDAAVAPVPDPPSQAAALCLGHGPAAIPDALDFTLDAHRHRAFPLGHSALIADGQAFSSA